MTVNKTLLVIVDPTLGGSFQGSMVGTMFIAGL